MEKIKQHRKIVLSTDDFFNEIVGFGDDGDHVHTDYLENAVDFESKFYEGLKQIPEKGE